MESRSSSQESWVHARRVSLMAIVGPVKKHVEQFLYDRCRDESCRSWQERGKTTLTIGRWNRVERRAAFRLERGREREREIRNIKQEIRVTEIRIVAERQIRKSSRY